MFGVKRWKGSPCILSVLRPTAFPGRAAKLIQQRPDAGEALLRTDLVAHKTVISSSWMSAFNSSVRLQTQHHKSPACSAWRTAVASPR